MRESVPVLARYHIPALVPQVIFFGLHVYQQIEQIHGIAGEILGEPRIGPLVDSAFCYLVANEVRSVGGEALDVRGGQVFDYMGRVVLTKVEAAVEKNG